MSWNDVLKQHKSRRARNSSPPVSISAYNERYGAANKHDKPGVLAEFGAAGRTDDEADCACEAAKPPFMEGVLLGAARSESCPGCLATASVLGVGGAPRQKASAHRLVAVRLEGSSLMLRKKVQAEGRRAQCLAAFCDTPMLLGRECTVSRNPEWPEAFTIVARLEGHAHLHSLELVAHKHDAEAWWGSFEDAQVRGKCCCAEGKRALQSCPPSMQTLEPELSTAALGHEDVRGSRSASHTPEGSPRLELFVSDDQSLASSYSLRKITKLLLETSFYMWLKITLAGWPASVIWDGRGEGEWRRVGEEEEEVEAEEAEEKEEKEEEGKQMEDEDEEEDEEEDEDEDEDEDEAAEAESEAVHEAVHTKQQGQTRSSAPSFSRTAPALVTGRPLVPGFDGGSAGPAGKYNLITRNVEVQTFRSPMEEQEEEGRPQELSDSEFDNESAPPAATPEPSVVVLSLDSVVPGVNVHYAVRQSACSEPAALVKDCARKTRTFGSTNPFWAFLHWHKAVVLLIQAETGLILSVFMEWRELSSAPNLAHAMPPQAMDGVIKDLVNDADLPLAVPQPELMEPELIKPELMEPNNTPLLKQPIPKQYPSEATPPPGTGEDSRARTQQHRHPRISRSWLSLTSFSSPTFSSPTCADGLATHGRAKCMEANPSPLLKRAISSQYPLSSGKKIELNVNDD
jgi:hypothetical protein